MFPQLDSETTEIKCLLTDHIASVWNRINWGIWEKGNGICHWAYFDLKSGGLLPLIPVPTLHKFSNSTQVLYTPEGTSGSLNPMVINGFYTVSTVCVSPGVLFLL